MRQDGNLPKSLEIPINDEHYYEPREYFMKSRQYDSYPRDRKSKVYLGEYASKDKKLIDALAEALYLLHVERNGDVVVMTSYAPSSPARTPQTGTQTLSTSTTSAFIPHAATTCSRCSDSRRATTIMVIAWRWRIPINRKAMASSRSSR